MANTGITLDVHNDGNADLEVQLEPTGECVEVAAGESCQLESVSGRVEIHTRTGPLIVCGALPAGQGRSPTVLASADDLRAYFVARGDQIFRDATGCNLFRESHGQMHAIGITWGVVPGVVELHSALAFTAPAEREREMALAVVRVNARAQVVGFRMLPPSTGLLHFTYATYVYFDAGGRVQASVLERAITISLAHIDKHGPDLQRMASGGTVA